jgi:putative membrane protein
MAESTSPKHDQSPAPGHPMPADRCAAPPVRCVFGGVLMGLANLVPGISGGTMLLASGVYSPFVHGVAEVSTFRFRPRTLLTLICIVGAAMAAIVGLAGPIADLVVHHRWIMYAVFIGLTLGGVPVIWRMVRPLDTVVIVLAIAGIALMAVMAFVGPASGDGASEGGHPYGMLFVAGLAGAAAMVLPGVSGGYLLLILGQYVTILAAVAALKAAVQERDGGAILATMHTIVPVGLGVVVGVVGVSNVVKVLLDRFERGTLGFLLGLLLGAVIGLWPFQHGVAPEVGSVFRGDRVAEVDGRLVMESTGRDIEAKDYPTAVFRPTALHVAGALGIIGLGLVASLGIARVGSQGRE